MTIKYGCKWEKDRSGYLGIYLKNPVYAIGSTLNRDGSWTHELLTKQKCSLTGSKSYELPRNQNSWFDHENVLEVVAIIEDRTEYWNLKNKS